jgi:hypothetical protein
LIILLYSWLQGENHVQNSGDFFPFFPSLLAIENLPNYFIFEFSFVEISPKTARVSFGLAEKDRLAETSTEQ